MLLESGAGLGFKLCEEKLRFKIKNCSWDLPKFFVANYHLKDGKKPISEILYPITTQKLVTYLLLK